MPSSTVQLSVALVTCNRPDSLERGLASLRFQSVQPFELIVSDDSERYHVEQVRKTVAEYGGIYCPGPRRGLYSNRNFIAEQCHGTHIRTMDDDHILPPNHLALCFEALKSDPSAIWTTGEIGYLSDECSRIAHTADQHAHVGARLRESLRNHAHSIRARRQVINTKFTVAIARHLPVR